MSPLVQRRRSGAEEARGPAEPGVQMAAAATLSVGMTIALAAVFMTFAAVLLAYAVVRVQAPRWPPAGEAAAPGVWPWPLVATVAALAGSGALAVATRFPGGTARFEDRVTSADVAATNRRRLRGWLTAAGGAAVAFLAIQASAWIWLMRAGVRPDSGLVGSVVYALTVFHAAHALAALAALAPFVARAWAGGHRPPTGVAGLRAVAAFWHLVTILWLVVALVVFVL